MTRIVSPSEVSEHLTAYFDELPSGGEKAGEVARAIEWLGSLQAINLDRLAGYVTDGDFALSVPHMVDIIQERVTERFGVKPEDQAHALIKKLRALGYSVVAFSPDELLGAEGGRLEDVLIERGNDFIATHGTERPADDLAYMAEMERLIISACENYHTDYGLFMQSLLNSLEQYNETSPEPPELAGDLLTHFEGHEGLTTVTNATAAALDLIKRWRDMEDV